MLTFEPPELQKQLAQAVKDWNEKLELDFELLEEPVFLYDLCLEDFDPSQYEDETIDPSYLVKITLPRWDSAVLVFCQEFIDLLEELKDTKLHGNKACRSKKRILNRVQASSETTVTFLYHAVPEADDEKEEEIRKSIIDLREKIHILNKKLDDLSNDDPLRDKIIDEWLEKRDQEQELFQKIQKSTERFCTQKFTLDDGIEICCSLTRGFTIFGILVASNGEYDKYFPPILDTDLFVEIVFNQAISERLEQNIFEAYLFELSSSLDINFEISPRPYIDTIWLDERCDSVSQDPRLRPLIIGKGTTELLRLYNKAISSQDLDVEILYFTKTIEYVSQTVIRIQSNEAIRAKLLSSRALQPDAVFISELESIFEAQRNKKRDQEAIRQTIITCCEASELANVAPNFLKEFKNISVESSSQDKIKALEALGSSLYSTRNQVAHAKANYTLTGKECPEDQLADFAKCVKLATQQVIRWYHFTPESIRLT